VTLPPNIRVNLTVPFPAQVIGSGQITVTKNNGVWTIGQVGTPLFVNSAGFVTIGSPVSVGGFNGSSPFNGSLEVQISSASGIAGLQIIRWDNSGNPSKIYLGKSRGGAVGVLGPQSVNSGDAVGVIMFGGSDGTTINDSAYILVGVDAAPASGTTPGRMMFMTTGAGTNANPTERVRINSTGSLMMAAGALATTATDGFFYVNACAGAPTGVPTAPPGGAKAMVYDTTNNKLWVYNGSWRGVVLA
jgi:hypothetical protein